MLDQELTNEPRDSFAAEVFPPSVVMAAIVSRLAARGLRDGIL